MFSRASIVTLTLLLSTLLAGAEVVPVPPQFVQHKQLPGEDQFSIARPVFSPDGAFVAALMHSSKTLTVWDVKTGKVVAEIAGDVHGFDGVDGLEFSTDGTKLLMLRKDLPLKYVDWKTGKVVKEVPLAADPKKIYSYAFSPKQDLVAVGTGTGIALWDLNASKKLKTYQDGKLISGLDMLYYTDPKTKKLVRLLGYSRGLLPPEMKWENVAGLIDLDSGKVTHLLNDVPADKKIDGKMTFTTIDFEYGGSHVLISYFVFPPTVKAGAFLVNTWTAKHLSNHDLGQKTIAFRTKYLWKPYYGFVISTADMTKPEYGIATDFLVTTQKEGLKIIDTVDETTLPVQQIVINKSNDMAAIVTKKGQSDPAKLFLYKVQPKK